MYLERVAPLAVDPLALMWTKRAADLHNARVLNNMGFIYTEGKGVPKDAKEATKYYRRSAARHDRNGSHSL